MKFDDNDSDLSEEQKNIKTQILNITAESEH